MTIMLRTAGRTVQLLARRSTSHIARHRTICKSFYSTTADDLSDSPSKPDSKLGLFATFQNVLSEKQDLVRELKSKGAKKVGEVKVENVLGGMRGLKSMVWEGSVLDANEGIRFHGYTIADCSRLLPKGRTGKEMLPEAMFWLLLTGKIPSTHQVRNLSGRLAGQAKVSRWMFLLIKHLPRDLHPMAKMSIAVTALDKYSNFANLYKQGRLSKSEYWLHTFNDAIDVIAKLPQIASLIWQFSCLTGKPEEIQAKGAALREYESMVDPDEDWAYNFAVRLGYGGKGEKNEGMQDLLRLYIALHADHEGGNVSAHATHLVGSALSSPALAYSAGLQGLAGPLHGLAAQEVLRFIQKIHTENPAPHTLDTVSAYLRAHLASGQVIPGYGHAVLRQADPRFTALMQFASSRPTLTSNPLFELVKLVSETAPAVLTEHGKTKNPHPNVDSASGVLFHGFGIHDPMFYTVIFGVSRALGPLAQLIWDRALGLPIERPKSINLAGLKKLADEAGD